ncbi:MAG: carbohydrate kinase family protein [Bacilli bacterium]|nr:carbohydrate kinase family protein [Bacilli bacterium]
MKIMCIGQSAYDITLPLDHYPVENKKVRVENKVECGGGSASNCAFLLAKWGLDSYFAGVIGNDHYGSVIKKEYETIGVNTKYLQVSDKYPTTSSYIIANTSIGSRTILTSKNSNIHMEKSDVEDNFDFILLDGYEREFAEEVIRKNPNAIKILDAGSMKEATVELAKVVDYVVCSHDFAEDVSKVKIDYDDIDTIIKAYKKLKEEFKGNIIITLESYGCFTCIDGMYKIIPSIKVEAVDSTGAGDIFHGAFVYSLAKGFDLRKALLFSNITGALSVKTIGSRLSIPELESVIEKYNDVISK